MQKLDISEVKIVVFVLREDIHRLRISLKRAFVVILLLENISHAYINNRVVRLDFYSLFVSYEGILPVADFRIHAAELYIKDCLVRRGFNSLFQLLNRLKIIALFFQGACILKILVRFAAHLCIGIHCAKSENNGYCKY